MKDRYELEEICKRLADEAEKLGCYGVIVAVSDEFPKGHSSYNIAARGRCIEIEGLAARVAKYARNIWDSNESSRIVAKDGRVFEERAPGLRVFEEVEKATIVCGGHE